MERAAAVMRRQEALLVCYDTRRIFGCNGTLDVLIEPVSRDPADGLLPAAHDCLRRRTSLVVRLMSKPKFTVGGKASYWPTRSVPLLLKPKNIGD